MQRKKGGESGKHATTERRKRRNNVPELQERQRQGVEIVRVIAK